MIGGDGFLGNFFALKSLPKSGFVYYREQLSFSIPLQIVKMPQFMANSYKGVEKYIPTFFLSAWPTLSRCHSCHTVTHAHICSMIHGKAKKQMPELAQHQIENWRPIYPSRDQPFNRL